MAQSTPAVTIVADRLYSLIGLCIGCPSMSSIHVFLKISDHRSSFLDKQIRGWPGFTPPVTVTKMVTAHWLTESCCQKWTSARIPGIIVSFSLLAIAQQRLKEDVTGSPVRWMR